MSFLFGGKKQLEPFCLWIEYLGTTKLSVLIKSEERAEHNNGDTRVILGSIAHRRGISIVLNNWSSLWRAHARLQHTHGERPALVHYLGSVGWSWFNAFWDNLRIWTTEDTRSILLSTILGLLKYDWLKRLYIFWSCNFSVQTSILFFLSCTRTQFVFFLTILTIHIALFSLSLRRQQLLFLIGEPFECCLCREHTRFSFWEEAHLFPWRAGNVLFMFWSRYWRLRW